MAQWNSDGYIMIDFESVDFRRTNQTIEGLFNRLDLVYKTNKVVFIINAHSKSPLVGVVSIVNGQYVIETNIYTFSITIDDNLHIKRNDVPASDIIDDSTTSADKTWSSSKITDELATKADTSALADYQPLLTAGTNITIDENNVISATDTGAVIDDTTTALDKVWSSSKVSNELSTKADVSALSDYQLKLTAGSNITIDSSNEISANVSAVINDTTASATTTYSSNKIDNLLGGIVKSFTYTGSGSTTNNIIFPTIPKFILSISSNRGDPNKLDNRITSFGYGSLKTTTEVLQNVDTLSTNPRTVEVSYNFDVITITGTDIGRVCNITDVVYTVYYI